RLFALALMTSVAAPALAQDVPVDVARLSEHIRVLSSDEFEGRGIGTEGERRTIAYLSEQFAAHGFEPGGVNGGWTQPVPLRRFAVSSPRGQIRVGDWSTDLVQGENVVISTRLPNERVVLQDAPLVFVGYGIHAPERDWNDFEG